MKNYASILITVYVEILNFSTEPASHNIFFYGYTEMSFMNLSLVRIFYSTLYTTVHYGHIMHTLPIHYNRHTIIQLSIIFRSLILLPTEKKLFNKKLLL